MKWRKNRFYVLRLLAYNRTNLSFAIGYIKDIKEKKIMPYVSITTAKKLDDATKAELYSKIGELMPILPGKNPGNTLLAVNDGVSMFMSGKPDDGVFVSVQLLKKSPEESKKEFSRKFYEVLKDVLKIDGGCVYMNFTEFENWAANGNYF